MKSKDELLKSSEAQDSLKLYTEVVVSVVKRLTEEGHDFGSNIRLPKKDDRK